MMRASGLLFAVFLPVAAYAQTGSIATVSAASYAAAVAPNSLAAIFGSGLATSKASATLDSSGQLPTRLADTTVEVNGEASPLIYVSQSQINLVIPADTATGVANIVVRTGLGSTLQGTVHVGDTAPGLFSLDASGKGPGAILNATTFTAGPFLVETSEISGPDKRTRLAVFATGIRAADQVTLAAHDASGNPFSVEFAGAAPGFFGLDQLNIILPPEIDGAGVVSLVVSTASGGSSNTVTFQVNSMPAGAIHLAGLTLSPAVVTAGEKVQATVSLNGRAPIGGIITSIQASNSAAQVPFSVTVPQGKASTQFTFGTIAVNSTLTATITAQAAGITQTAALEIDSANAIQLRSFTVDATTLQGGRNLSATVMLSGPAPVDGATIALTSDNSAIKVPATLKVPFGQQLATITIPTPIVTAAQTVHLTATFGRTVQTVTITLNPPFTLTLSSDSVTGGGSVTGTLTFSEVPAAASSVTLRSSDVVAQIQPATIAMAQNQQSATFTVTTNAVTASRTVTITGSSSLFSGITQTASLTVNPPGVPQLESVTITPALVMGGQTAMGMIALTDPAPVSGIVVTLKTSDVQHAQLVQQFVVVPFGQKAGSFSITTSPVSSTQTITITATASGMSKSAVLKIQ